MGEIQNGISDLVILKNRNTKYSHVCILNIVRLVIGQYFLNFSSKGTSFLTYNVFYRHLHGSWKWKKVKVAQLCLTLCNPMDYTALAILQARILDWIAFRFSRGSSQPRDGTPDCRWILYQLIHKGSPRILEWVAYPFSRSSQSRNQTRVSCIAGGFLTNWTIRKAVFTQTSTEKPAHRCL